MQALGWSEDLSDVVNLIFNRIAFYFKLRLDVVEVLESRDEVIFFLGYLRPDFKKFGTILGHFRHIFEQFSIKFIRITLISGSKQVLLLSGIPNQVP